MGKVSQHFAAEHERSYGPHVRPIRTHQLSRTGEWFAWREFGPLGAAGIGKTEEEAIDDLLVKEMA